jgi:hypothetical protein
MTSLFWLKKISRVKFRIAISEPADLKVLWRDITGFLTQFVVPLLAKAGLNLSSGICDQLFMTTATAHLLYTLTVLLLYTVYVKNP